MLTLFRIMTLDEWINIVQPLFETAGWTYPFFMLYICISALALMNLVTAVVVETSVKRTQEDADYQQQLFNAAVQSDCKKIQELFAQIDTSGDGEIEREEFEERGGGSELLHKISTALQLTLNE